MASMHSELEGNIAVVGDAHLQGTPLAFIMRLLVACLMSIYHVPCHVSPAEQDQQD